MSRNDVYAAIRRALSLDADAELPTWFEQSCPTVSLEEFFEDNADAGSIGCNLDPSNVDLDTFSRVLRDIRARRKVRDVRVGITELVDEHSWPFSDVVYVIGSVDVRRVRRWLAPLMPDDVNVVPGMEMSPPPLLDPGEVVIRAWWD